MGWGPSDGERTAAKTECVCEGELGPGGPDNCVSHLVALRAQAANPHRQPVEVSSLSAPRASVAAVSASIHCHVDALL